MSERNRWVKCTHAGCSEMTYVLAGESGPARCAKHPRPVSVLLVLGICMLVVAAIAIAVRVEQWRKERAVAEALRALLDKETREPSVKIDPREITASTSVIWTSSSIQSEAWLLLPGNLGLDHPTSDRPRKLSTVGLRFVLRTPSGELVDWVEVIPR